MTISPEAKQCLDLVLDDLREALTADRLVSLLDTMEPTDPSTDVLQGLYFVSGSLALRMGLGVNRLLQEPGSDRATLTRLLRLVNGNVPAATADELGRRLAAIRHSPDAILLKQCRDGFSAHTLIGPKGNRDGMPAVRVADLLHIVFDLVQDICAAVGYDQFDGDIHFTRWQEIADRTARAIVSGASGTLEDYMAELRAARRQSPVS